MCSLNSACVEDLVRLPGVDLVLAHSLMLWRPYADWAEVERVPGFDWEAVAALRAAGAEIQAPPVRPGRSRPDDAVD